MKIIADSGATKGVWKLVSDNGETVRTLITDGTNVSAMHIDIVIKRIHATCEELTKELPDKRDISALHLYTAGLTTEEIKSRLTETLEKFFPDSYIEIADDLTGAARAVCGRSAGLAAILGTGSNACLYDGKEITAKIYSGGFILGDEGSAAALGKAFLSDFLKGLVPHNIASEFSKRYPSDYCTIINNVYRSAGSPSAYLGSFAPFVLEHYNDPYIKKLTDDNFRSFINRSLKRLDSSLPVGITGGFGFALKDIFLKVADEEGITVSGFIQTPIERLIDYHCNE